MQIRLAKAMFVVIWEYQVKPEHVSDFERIYSSNGLWADLFRKDEGFLGAELLRAAKAPHRYITIDRWKSSKDYEVFLQQWAAEYAMLDAQCEGLTERESLLGKWESTLPET